MEYRKLISFGKSSFVVSLPKSWIEKQNLKKGDIIYFDESGNNLILNPKETERKEESKEIVINIDGKSNDRIGKEIIPAYVNGYKTITIRGKDLRKKVPEIQRIISNLVALEIMEQTSDTIVAKDFLNIEDIPLSNLIRKMDIITRSMFMDSIKTFDEDNYSSIYLRDSDVNKLYYLVSRIVRYGLNNQLKMAKLFGATVENIVEYKWIAHYIESIADETKRIARYMREAKLDKNGKQTFTDFYSKIYQIYLDSMKAYFTADKKSALELTEKKEDLMKECHNFYQDNKGTTGIVNLVNHTRVLIASVLDICKSIYY